MKLNIEELAREAGIEFDPRWGMGTVGNKQIERLARLIVERCAQECESLFDLDDDSCNEAEKCAAAIRNLMGD